MYKTHHRWLLTLALALCFGASESWAQDRDTWDSHRMQLTRVELEQLLEKFEQTGRSPSYSNEFRLHANAEAERVRRRLSEGDFQTGDHIEVLITGEPNMPLTLTVGPGRTLTIPNLEELSLAGVLRSELNERLLKHVSRFIKDPTVRSRSSVRILVMGQVARPGFISAPAESLISDLITQAGGPTINAKIASARIERGTERILEGQALQDAITEGRTLDQMSLRSGDQFLLPDNTSGRGGSFLRVAAMVPAALLAISGLLQLF